MVLKKLKVLTLNRPKRGTKDAVYCVELCGLNWEEIQTAFGKVSEQEQEDLSNHFNSAVEGVGDALFGEDLKDFKTKMNGLNDEEQKAFVEALIESELIADM